MLPLREICFRFVTAVTAVTGVLISGSLGQTLGLMFVLLSPMIFPVNAVVRVTPKISQKGFLLSPYIM